MNSVLFVTVTIGFSSYKERSSSHLVPLTEVLIQTGVQKCLTSAFAFTFGFCLHLI